MKTVKSLADATQLALRAGATLDAGGRRVNAGGAQLAVVRQADRPAPAPAPVEREQPDALERLAGLIERQAASVEALARAAAHQAPQQAQPMRPVRLAVVRDADRRALALVPTYGPGSGRPAGFDRQLGPDGLIETITPIY